MPPNNCLMAQSCMAGICFTPSLDASQVVPQKKHTHANASNAFCFEVLDESIFFSPPAGGGAGGVLVFKMPEPGDHHGQVMLFAKFNGIIITD